MDMYDVDYYVNTASNKISFTLVWSIISVVVAIVGGITLYYTVFSKKNKDKYKGFMKNLYDFVNFKFFIIDDLFRILYLISAIMITLFSFTYLGSWKFVTTLILGNLGLRIIYELMLLFNELCINVREINKKIKK